MNIDTLAGEGTDLKGRFKESVGNAIGDRELQREGAGDQVAGNARKAVGGIRDFVRNQPYAAAAVMVVLGLVVFGGSRRGRAD
jgi:uncharacterized protein YjbJ (UPF0337 family)